MSGFGLHDDRSILVESPTYAARLPVGMIRAGSRGDFFEFLAGPVMPTIALRAAQRESLHDGATAPGTA